MVLVDSVREGAFNIHRLQSAPPMNGEFQRRIVRPELPGPTGTTGSDRVETTSNLPFVARRRRYECGLQCGGIEAQCPVA